jgi:uncharacterized protein (DUF1778 family)
MPYIGDRRTLMPSIRKKPAAPKKPAARQREFKTQRLELRLAPLAKKVIHQAMSITGLAAGDIAYEGARRLLDEHQRMVLLGADRDAFIAAIERNPEPAPRLVKALRQHRRMLG